MPHFDFEKSASQLRFARFHSCLAVKKNRGQKVKRQHFTSMKAVYETTYVTRPLPITLWKLRSDLFRLLSQLTVLERSRLMSTTFKKGVTLKSESTQKPRSYADL